MFYFTRIITIFLISLVLLLGCASQQGIQTSINDPSTKHVTAADILGNPAYPAFSYGGYRKESRQHVPSVADLKEDMKILAALGVKLIRTYNTQQYAHAENLLKAIRQLKTEDNSFEMYVMLGAWMDCEGAWTDNINHNAPDVENNTAEIKAAIEMVNAYPDIVKIIAVGNEAMVHWQTPYYVQPEVILKWVVHLQEQKKYGRIPADTWITSSDNFASWGGGSKNYHSETLIELIRSVDFISLHTYPFHDTYHHPDFWWVPAEEDDLSSLEKVEAAMKRSKEHAITQYQNTANYVKSLGIDKPIHIGETGWATVASTLYGESGSQAADEVKEKIFYEDMREWSNKEGMSLFFFEAFDEPWKDKRDALGSENHFGLFNRYGQAKYALWDEVDKGTFEGLTRNGKPITKTYNGNEEALFKDLLIPPSLSNIVVQAISSVNPDARPGSLITSDAYIILHDELVPNADNNYTYPSTKLKLNAWEGTCAIELTEDGYIKVSTGTGAWWGSALEIQGDTGEDFSQFTSGTLHITIRGKTQSSFNLGFQTGYYAAGNQTNNFVTFGPDKDYTITSEWQTYSIPVTKLNNGANFKDVTSLLYFTGDGNFDGKAFYVKDIYYSKK